MRLIGPVRFGVIKKTVSAVIYKTYGYSAYRACALSFVGRHLYNFVLSRLWPCNRHIELSKNLSRHDAGGLL